MSETTEKARTGEQMRAELAEANARADRLYQDRYDLLGVKTTEGLSASEWVMRTAAATRERDALREERDALRAELERLKAEAAVGIVEGA
jgi:hypothetical protein